MGDEPELAPPDSIGVPKPEDHVAEWKERTQGIDRVISVVLSIEQPRTVEWIAEQAHVSESTARSHLERLVELRVLTAVEQRGAKTYYPDSVYQRFREVSSLVEERDREEIEAVIISAQEEIEALRDEYGVESVDELRKKATEEETPPEVAREYFTKASQWDEHSHMLSIAREALDRYSDITGEDWGSHHTPA